MEEIPNNHLGCIKPCKQWDNLHINWCRISSIDSISGEVIISREDRAILAHVASNFDVGHEASWRLGSGLVVELSVNHHDYLVAANVRL